MGRADALKDLNALTNLKLNLGASNVTSIDALKGLNAPTNLTLLSTRAE